SNDLEHREQQQQLPTKLPVHRLVHDIVARTHYLRKPEIADAADDQARNGGLDQLQHRWLSAKKRTKPADCFGEDKSSQPTEYAQCCIGKEFARINQIDDRDA